MPRQEMPIVIGKGLDRATGLVGVNFATPVDVRNVYARDGKMALRPGMIGTGFPPLAWGTDILAIWGVKATLDVLFVVYDRPTLAIRIYRLDPVNNVLQTLSSPADGLWGLAGSSAEFPVVSVAEADGKVFFAHDEANIAARLPTVYYTPNFVTPATVGTLTTLTADLNGDGASATVYFRGVIAYLEYMSGWGYGSETVGDLDRGDIFRISKPAQPTVWAPGDYFLAGVRRDPIIAAVPCRMTSSIGTVTSVLALLKNDQSFRVVGSSPDDFGIEDLDVLYGAISSRAVVSIGGTAYAWASDGPRMVTPAGTAPIGQPLELVSPLPGDFPPLGPGRLAFVAYDQSRYRLAFCFPDIDTGSLPVPAFSLSLWRSEDPRWTFDLISQPVTCAGRQLLRDVGSSATAPTGYPVMGAVVDESSSADATYRSVLLRWTNTDNAGDEFVQLFAKPLGGAWSLVTTLASVVGAESGSWASALPVTSYSVAMRLIRGSTPAVGYEDMNPDNWTSPHAALSKATFSTTSSSVAWVSETYFDANKTVSLIWTSAQLAVPYLLEKNPGSGWVTVVADLVASSYVYPIPVGEQGTSVQFRVTAQRGAVVGPTSGAVSVECFVDIGQPAWVSATFSQATGMASLTWTAAQQALQYLLEKTLNAGVSWTTVATVSAPTVTYTYIVPIGEMNTTVGFRVTGQNGAVSGTPSATQNLAMTVTLGTTVLNAPIWTLGRYQLEYYGTVALTWSVASGADSYLVEKQIDAGPWWTIAQIAATSYVDSTGSSQNPPNELLSGFQCNRTIGYRITPHNAILGFGTVSNVATVVTTIVQDETVSAWVWNGRTITATFGPDGSGYLLNP